MADPARKRLTFLEYDVLDEVAEDKHQLVDGVAYAMSGGSLAHARLGLRVGRVLDTAYDGTGCAVYNSELRVRVEESGNAFYADVTVVCGSPRLDAASPRTVLNPVVLVEVLSASTEAFDRGRKWMDYQKIPSLHHYLLVSQTEVRIEHYTRADTGWMYTAHGPGDVVDLGAVTVPVDDVYRGVKLTEPTLYAREPGPDELASALA